MEYEIEFRKMQTAANRDVVLKEGMVLAETRDGRLVKRKVSPQLRKIMKLTRDYTPRRTRKRDADKRPSVGRTRRGTL